jgi:two-component system response regulator MprA
LERHSKNLSVVPEKRKWRILVVDDSAVCRKSTARILKLDGHYVDEADDGIECIFMIQLAADYNHEPYDCTVLDDDMPHLSGHEAVKLLRAKGFDKLVVVVLTGNRNDDHLQHFKDNGADLVIRKPLTEALWKRIFESLRTDETPEDLNA